MRRKLEMYYFLDKDLLLHQRSVTNVHVSMNFKFNVKRRTKMFLYSLVIPKEENQTIAVKKTKHT